MRIRHPADMLLHYRRLRSPWKEKRVKSRRTMAPRAATMPEGAAVISPTNPWLTSRSANEPVLRRRPSVTTAMASLPKPGTGDPVEGFYGQGATEPGHEGPDPADGRVGMRDRQGRGLEAPILAHGVGVALFPVREDGMVGGLAARLDLGVVPLQGCGHVGRMQALAPEPRAEEVSVAHAPAPRVALLASSVMVWEDLGVVPSSS